MAQALDVTIRMHHRFCKCIDRDWSYTPRQIAAIHPAADHDADMAAVML